MANDCDDGKDATDDEDDDCLAANEEDRVTG